MAVSLLNVLRGEDVADTIIVCLEAAFMVYEEHERDAYEGIDAKKWLMRVAECMFTLIDMSDALYVYM